MRIIASSVSHSGQPSPLYEVGVLRQRHLFLEQYWRDCVTAEPRRRKNTISHKTAQTLSLNLCAIRSSITYIDVSGRLYQAVDVELYILQAIRLQLSELVFEWTANGASVFKETRDTYFVQCRCAIAIYRTIEHRILGGFVVAYSRRNWRKRNEKSATLGDKR